MADDNTQEIITACVVLTVISTIAADFLNQKANGKPTGSEIAKPLVGGAVAGAFLFGIAIPEPKIAKNFAILMVLGALLRNGNGLFSLASKLTGGKSTVAATQTVSKASSVASSPGGSTYNSQVPAYTG